MIIAVRSQVKHFVDLNFIFVATKKKREKSLHFFFVFFCLFVECILLKLFWFFVVNEMKFIISERLNGKTMNWMNEVTELSSMKQLALMKRVKLIWIFFSCCHQIIFTSRWTWKWILFFMMFLLVIIMNVLLVNLKRVRKKSVN